MATYIVRVTLEDEQEYKDLEEARKEADRWAEGLADSEACKVFYVEVWPKS